MGHLGNLLRMVGDEIGTPRADRTDLQWQDLGLRVEYIANVLQGHVGSLDHALRGCEAASDLIRTNGRKWGAA